MPGNFHILIPYFHPLPLLFPISQRTSHPCRRPRTCGDPRAARGGRRLLLLCGTPVHTVTGVPVTVCTGRESRTVRTAHWATSISPLTTAPSHHPTSHSAEKVGADGKDLNPTKQEKDLFQFQRCHQARDRVIIISGFFFEGGGEERPTDRF